MAARVHQCARAGFLLVLTLNVFYVCKGQVLTPPTFNLAKGREITATATCGVGTSKPELYCQLTGVVDETEDQKKTTGKEIIQVKQNFYQVCKFFYLFIFF